MSEQEGGERGTCGMLPSRPGRAVLLMNHKLSAALVAYSRPAQYQTCKNSIINEGEAHESPPLVRSLCQLLAAGRESVLLCGSVCC